MPGVMTRGGASVAAVTVVAFGAAFGAGSVVRGNGTSAPVAHDKAADAKPAVTVAARLAPAVALPTKVRTTAAAAPGTTATRPKRAARPAATPAPAAIPVAASAAPAQQPAPAAAAPVRAPEPGPQPAPQAAAPRPAPSPAPKPTVKPQADAAPKTVTFFQDTE
jgi:hypothetical protein